MTQDGPIQITITVERLTGKLIEARDKNRKEAEQVDPEEIERIYNSQDGFRYVATLLHAHSSPGCIYYYDFALRRWVRICWPQ